MTVISGEVWEDLLTKNELSQLQQIKKHRSIYLVRDSFGEKVVKPFCWGAGKAYLIGELLKKSDQCTLIPRLIPAQNGFNYRWKKGNRYLVTEKLPGREADYFQIEDLQAAIQSMAFFHRFSQSVIQEKPLKWNLIRFFPRVQWPEYFREMSICREIAIRTGDDWSCQYLKVWYFYHRQAYAAIREITDLKTISDEVICYHDWAYHNLIIDKGIARLVDFDYMMIDLPVHDKINLIRRYLHINHWSTEALLKILWNFDRFYGWKSGEIKLLRIFLMFPYDYWILGRQYFIEKQPWSKKYFQDQWQRKVIPVPAIERLSAVLEALE